MSTVTIEDRLAQRQAERDQEIATTICDDAWRVVTGDMTVEKLDELIANHQRLGITHERFNAACDVLRKWQALSAELGDDVEWRAEQGRLVDELSKLNNERDAAVQRIEYLKGRCSGLSEELRTRHVIRNETREAIATLKAEHAELFGEERDA